MKTYIRKASHFIGFIFLFIHTFILLYVTTVLVCSFLPCNINTHTSAANVDIYILSNGVHTDLVLPTKTAEMDWTTLLFQKDITYETDSTTKWIGFGWGDKGFYLETPTWDDLTFHTAFNAAFALGTSAMHVSKYTSLKENDQCKKISITPENYQKLVTYLCDSFQKDDSGAFICIPGKHYTANDAFYEANGQYSLFKTCNTWTNTGLKIAGAKACLWTPLDKGIFWQY